MTPQVSADGKPWVIPSPNYVAKFLNIHCDPTLIISFRNSVSDQKILNHDQSGKKENNLKKL